MIIRSTASGKSLQTANGGSARRFSSPLRYLPGGKLKVDLHSVKRDSNVRQFSLYKEGMLICCTLVSLHFSAMSVQFLLLVISATKLSATHLWGCAGRFVGLVEAC